MNTKKVNLLSHHKNYVLYQNYFLIFKKIVYFLTGLFFVFLATFLILIINENKQINVLIQEEKNLQSFIQKNSPVEENFKNFLNLFSQLKENLNNDVNFYPHYNLINDSLKISTNPPKIESLTIDQNKKVDFTLSFDNINYLINFLDYVEKENFLTNFVELKLKSFSFDSKSISNMPNSFMPNSFKLSLVGQFKKLNNN